MNGDFNVPAEFAALDRNKFDQLLFGIAVHVPNQLVQFPNQAVNILSFPAVFHFGNVVVREAGGFDYNFTALFGGADGAIFNTASLFGNIRTSNAQFAVAAGNFFDFAHRAADGVAQRDNFLFQIVETIQIFFAERLQARD